MQETIESWLKKAAEKLKNAQIESTQLDAELILARVLGVNRTFLHSHSEKKIPKTKLFHANNWLNQRAKRVPLAYIFHEKEFFGRNFYVNSDTLIPRPETETMVDLVKKIADKADILLDVGTGSGIIPISICAEFNQEISVAASDISLQALAVANLNAKKLLGKTIPLFESNLLEKIPQNLLEKITIITANLPYVDREWIDSASPNELHFEPQNALYAEENGLLLNKLLLTRAANLPELKFILLEADPEQFDALIEHAQKFEFKLFEKANYTLVFRKALSK
ncbi:MAG: HemK/PrmC family methyltransferase [bacterium]|nr:HemK/PrmC family methyltransferase [bacterium]